MVMFLEIITRNLKQIIIIQLLLIIVLIGVVYRNIKQVNIIPIKSHNISFNQVDSLEYYYEPVNYPFDEPLPWDSDIKVVYTMNKDTIRANKEYAIPKPPNTLRIVAIGDSFTFGQFVNDDETYPAQLEVLLKEKLKGKYNNVEVINLGVPGYDIEYSIARYEKRGKKYNPDLILWLITGGDFLQNNEKELGIINWLKRHTSARIINVLNYFGIYYPFHSFTRVYIGNTLESEDLRLIENFMKIYSYRVLLMTTNEIPTKKVQFICNATQKANANPCLLLSNINIEVVSHFPDTHPNKVEYEIYTHKIADSVTKLANMNLFKL